MRTSTFAAFTAALLALLGEARPASAQLVRGQVVEEGSATPVEGAMVVLLDVEGRVVDRGLTGADGGFISKADRPGPYVIRVDRIGYESLTTDRFDVPVTGTFRQVSVPIHAVELEGLDVSGSRRCSLAKEQGQATARVWEEARKALEIAAWTLNSGVYRYTLVQFTRRLDQSGKRIVDENRRFVRGTGQAPYVSLQPEELVDKGFIQRTRNGDMSYFAPDANALLSDPFLETHCMRVEEVENGQIGLGFQPIKGRHLPDIRGTLWLDAATAHLDRLEFSYVNRPREHDYGEAGGEVRFGNLPNGTWVVRDWNVRMPVIVTNPQRSRYFVNGYEVQGGSVWRVTATDGSVVLEAEAATLSGTVVDSLGTRPVAEVGVVVSGDSTSTPDAVTKPDGTFVLSGLPGGGQTLALHSPALDTLGLGPVTFHVEGAVGDVTPVRLRLPAVHEILEAACGESGADASGTAVLLGRVLAGDAPSVGARVRLHYLGPGNFTASSVAVPSRGPGDPVWTLDPDNANRLVTTLDERGLFLICGLPEGAQLRLDVTGASGARSSRTVNVPPGERVVVTTMNLGEGSHP